MSSSPDRVQPSGLSGEAWCALILSGALTAWGAVFLRSVPAGLFDRAVALACLGLLFLPYFLFSAPGFTGWLRERRARALVLLPGYLLAIHVLYGVGPGRLSLPGSLAILVYIGVPVWLANLAGRRGDPPNLLDGITLLLLYFPVELSAFARAWRPVDPGLASPSHPFSQLLGMNLLLCCFLAIRSLPGVGFTFRLQARDVAAALIAFAGFFPVALILAGATGFVAIEPHLPESSGMVGVVLGTIFLVALPEEILFRGILQNLLERMARSRRGRLAALVAASVLFGLTHLNNYPLNDWRYVTIACIAGVAYGLVYRSTRKVTAAAITHGLVDVVWRLFF